MTRPVHEITTLDVAGILKPVWNTKPEVARKLYPAIRRVFDYARIRLRDDHGVSMPDNPARWDDLKAMGFEAPAKLSRGSHPSLPHERIRPFISCLRTRDAVAARALEFLILSNVRTDAVLKARWDDFDLDHSLWTVPVANLKDRKHRREGFRVPLPPRALEIVREMEIDQDRGICLPWPGADAAALEHGAVDAPQAHELRREREMGRRRRPPSDHGSWLPRDLPHLG